jgi:ribonuclease J
MLRKLDEDVNTMPPERVLILSTGAQGEEFAALTRMANGEHPNVQLNPTDLVMLSSSPIPGNERQMHRMMDNLTMQGVTLIATNDMDVHASGHG